VTVTAGGKVRAAVGGTVVCSLVVGAVEVVAASVVGAAVVDGCTSAAFDPELPHPAVVSRRARAAIGTERRMYLLIVTTSVAPERPRPYAPFAVAVTAPTHLLWRFFTRSRVDTKFLMLVGR
jgi:hypothetical protein